MAIRTGGLVNYNQLFMDTLEHIDTFLLERYRAHPRIWTDRIPKGTLSNYEGLTRKSNIFHGGLGEQAGLSNWSAIQVSRKAAGEDQGFDACQYDPKTFEYAIESVQYTGSRCSWQSEPVCVNDIRFLEEGRQQCELITSFMTYITQSVWENWNREQYIKQAIDGGNAFILTPGGLDYGSGEEDSYAAGTVRFTYDGTNEDADGDTYLTFSRTLKLSTLNWSFFDWWQDYLGDQCPDAALAMQDGLPIFGLMIHKRDFNRMVMRDNDLREDYRYANARVLIENYQSFKEFKGWMLIHDPRQARFAYSSDNGTLVTCKRVKPMKLGKSVTIGHIPIANAAYTKAEVALGVIFMNMIFQNLIPTPITNAGGGMIYGGAPGYEGTFKWINEYDKELNPLKEVGYFFARFESFPKPLMYSGEAIVFLYLREPQTWGTEQDITTHSEASDGPLNPTVAAVTGDVVTATKTVTLTLSTFLTGSVGDAVTIVSDTTSSTSWSALIADASDAPTYVFVGTTASPAYTEFDDLTATVTMV